MKQAKHYFERADCETLAIFDLDLVLIQPEDPAFQMPNIKRNMATIKDIAQSFPQEKRDILLALIALNTKAILIDEEVPGFLRELNQKGIPTIALTASLTGQLAAVANLELSKIDCLNKLGIDFSLGAPHQEKIVFSELPSNRGSHCLYLKGVLFTNGSCIPKGDALIRFLQRTQLHPKRIIFTDDSEENLINVERSLKEFRPDIGYEGVHYLEANHYPSSSISAQEFERKWKALAAQAIELD